MPPEKQSRAPAPKEFSPIGVIMHMALAEGFDLEQLENSPPASLEGQKARPSFIYRQALRWLRHAKKFGTIGSMVPGPGVTLVEASAAWEKARHGLRKHFESVKDPNAAMINLKFMGVLSASELLTLFEAHTHYHEALFPKV